VRAAPRVLIPSADLHPLGNSKSRVCVAVASYYWVTTGFLGQYAKESARIDAIVQCSASTTATCTNLNSTSIAGIVDADV
jgi:hypothetical protein